jgi:hypothetical protein
MGRKGERRIFMDNCGRVWEEGEDLVRPKDRGELPIELVAAAIQKGPETFDNLMAAGTPGGIERQEASGQRALVRSQEIPIKLGSPKELFEKLGFKFGRTVDKLFQEAELPKGWTKVPSPSHSSYSYVLDDKGRARWMMYYKAAFYDRCADGYSLQRRYVVRAQQNYDQNHDRKRDGETPIWGEVLDHGVLFDPKETYHGGVKPKVIHSGEKFTPKDVFDIDRVRKMVCLEMEMWIDARFPNYEDPLAYWD